jgi:glycosyltransferase involved in cell wall biosynthesis
MDPQPPLIKGINLVGHLTLHAGLGNTARAFARSIVDAGVEVAGYDVPIGYRRTASPGPPGVTLVSRLEDLPHECTLVCLSLPMLPGFLLRNRAVLQRTDRKWFALVYWELPVLPPIWRRALGFFDGLFAGSQFVRETLERELPHVPCVVAEHPIYLDDAKPAPRSTLGFGDEVVLFGSSFDLGSDFARKNPLAVLRAFRMAFPNAEPVGLFLKGNGNPSDIAGHPAARELEAALKSDPRIRFVCETISYDEVLSLYAACDVFASLHRSEGLGLGPLEAMTLGKAVIATGYSGNLSYMTPTNSMLVQYSLVRPYDCGWHYQNSYSGKGAYWAAPDLAQASRDMQALARSPQLRSALGSTARKEMQVRNAYANRALFLRSLSDTAAAGRRKPDRNAAAFFKLLLHEAFHPVHLRKRISAIC